MLDINIIKINNILIEKEKDYEDIEEIYFTGYVDEMEKEFLKQYELQKDKIKYPKLKIKAD